ncbi:MAG: threonine synthase [Bacteroidota bacterium]
MTPLPPPWVTGLRCVLCGIQYPHGDILTCPACGEEGILDVESDLESIRSALTREPLEGRPPTLERYRDFLPVSPSIAFPPLAAGWTPVVRAERLGRIAGLRELFLKDDGRNPTASFKDRASIVGVMKAGEFGYGTIACASTGNAASSLAGIAAASGLPCVIFVPEAAPEPKLTQLLIFGAVVFRVRGTYEDAFRLSALSCRAFGWYSRNSGTNPFLVEGKKTAGLEVAEQTAGSPPDWVAVPVGDGCTVGGIGKGLREMAALGRLRAAPRLLGIQAEGASPIAHAFGGTGSLIPAVPRTLADSIAVGTPRNWRRALHEIRSSGGAMVTVEDGEILEAMRLCARHAGVFAEPAAAAALAGLLKAVRTGVISAGESALVMITGNGLKDIRSARRAAGTEFTVDPDLDQVRALVRDSVRPGAQT